MMKMCIEKPRFSIHTQKSRQANIYNYLFMRFNFC